MEALTDTIGAWHPLVALVVSHDFYNPKKGWDVTISTAPANPLIT